MHTCDYAEYFKFANIFSKCKFTNNFLTYEGIKPFLIIFIYNKALFNYYLATFAIKQQLNSAIYNV